MDGSHVKMVSAETELLTIVPPGGVFEPMTIAEDYRGLACEALHWVPDFNDFTEYWARVEEPKLLALAYSKGRLTGFASFSAFALPFATFMGNRAIRIPMVQAGLFGGSVLGHFKESFAREIVERVFRDLPFDMLVLENLLLGNGLAEALVRGGFRKPRCVSERRTARRLIVLPNSYDEFLGTLRPSTVKAILRDQKMFGRLAPTYQVSTEVGQVAEFIVEAAAVSSIASKTERGAYGVADTPSTRQHLEKLAKEGRLRAYLATVDGRPVACAWGDVSHGVFYFRDTAYDPAFAKYSPGRAMLLYAIADVIQAGARIFDFGVIDFNYKARLSNHCLEAASICMASTSSPRGWLAIAIRLVAGRVKVLADRLGLHR